LEKLDAAKVDPDSHVRSGTTEASGNLHRERSQARGEDVQIALVRAKNLTALRVGGDHRHRGDVRVRIPTVANHDGHLIVADRNAVDRAALSRACRPDEKGNGKTQRHPDTVDRLVEWQLIDKEAVGALDGRFFADRAQPDSNDL